MPLKPGATVTERVVRRRQGASAAAQAAPAVAKPEEPIAPVDDPKAALRRAVLLSSDQFDAGQYLVTVHKDTSATELRAGLARIQEDKEVHVTDIQTLVKDNFERFISCKTTIDDVLNTLRRAEGIPGGAQPPSGSSRKAAAAAAKLPTPQQAQTQRMSDSVRAVQNEANKVLGPLLERQGQLDSVRGVLAVLRRHRSLFGLPSRLRAAAQRGDVHAALREWRAARALIGPHEAPVMHRLLAVAEREVNALERGLRWIVAAPGSTMSAAEVAAGLVLDIAAVRVGGADAGQVDAVSADSTTGASVARDLVLSFVSGRAAKLSASVQSAVTSLQTDLAQRQRTAARRAAEAADAAARAGTQPMNGDSAAITGSASQRLGRTSSQTLDAALEASHGAAAGAAVAAAGAVAAAAAETAATEGAAERRCACVRACCVAALACLPDAWRFATSVTGSNARPTSSTAAAAQQASSAPSGGFNPLHKRSASAGSVLDAFSPRGGVAPPPAFVEPPVEAVLKKTTEALCAQLRAELAAVREGHLRLALADVSRVARAMGDLGAPLVVFTPLEELRVWAMARLVDDLCERMRTDALAAASISDDSPAPGADVAAAWATLSLNAGGDGSWGIDVHDGEDAEHKQQRQVRQLRVSTRPLAFSAAVARGMAALIAVAADGGAQAAKRVSGESSSAFVECFHDFADALASRAEAANVVNRDGSAPESAIAAAATEDATNIASDWQGTAMALLADSAFVRLWVLPALTTRFQMAWSVPVPSTGAPPDIEGMTAAAEDVLGALEEHVLSGYTQRHALALAPLCAAFFDGDAANTDATVGRTMWLQWPPPVGVRDVVLTWLDGIVAAHAVAHMRAGPFTDGVLGALATAAVQQLAVSGSASSALSTPCMSSHGFCQLALERAFLQHALRGYASEEQSAAWEALLNAAMDCAVATAKQQVNASGRSGFSRTATRASLTTAAQEVVDRLLARELDRTALHTRCFPVPADEPASVQAPAAAPAQSIQPAAEAPPKRKKSQRKVILQAET